MIVKSELQKLAKAHEDAKPQPTGTDFVAKTPALNSLIARCEQTMTEHAKAGRKHCTMTYDVSSVGHAAFREAVQTAFAEFKVEFDNAAGSCETVRISWE